ncbi:hypothetical protein Q5425_37225 [Amycolatopsis sp. A133]|uniref:hypothetical protein n=1 Tax=Amycolatopsis sp. A133 TaxID=3064472 RepID=UPI0027FD6B1C|nr:hypothetical protein [Amycolatopsis sp. A133]MDQ7809399.1 hypothetical protein [Amycolatopsis sp. A133]
MRQVSRAIYTVTNPLGAAENALLNSVTSSRSRGRRTTSSSRGRSTRPSTSRATPATPAVSATDVRAAEGAAAHRHLAELMAVQRERFAPVQRPMIPVPPPIDPAVIEQQEWAKIKHEARPWQRARRRELRQEAANRARQQATELNTRAREHHRIQQAQADAWWAALQRGDAQVLRAALDAAFADNPAPVMVTHADRQHANLVVLLPGLEVLPPKKAHMTPTGRLSSKAWTKTELNDVYADLLGAHLLATVREAWATGPSLTHLKVTGIRRGPGNADERLFTVEVDRVGTAWQDDHAGATVLQIAPHGLNRVGRTREVRAWSDGTAT